MMTFHDLGCYSLGRGRGRIKKGEGGKQQGAGSLVSWDSSITGLANFLIPLNEGSILNHGCLYSHKCGLPTGLCLTSHESYFYFPEMLGRGKGIKLSSRHSCSIPLHSLPLWHADNLAAKQPKVPVKEWLLLSSNVDMKDRGPEKPRKQLKGIVLEVPYKFF